MLVEKTHLKLFRLILVDYMKYMLFFYIARSVRPLCLYLMLIFPPQPLKSILKQTVVYISKGHGHVNSTSGNEEGRGGRFSVLFVYATQPPRLHVAGVGGRNTEMSRFDVSV